MNIKLSLISKESLKATLKVEATLTNLQNQFDYLTYLLIGGSKKGESSRLLNLPVYWLNKAEMATEREGMRMRKKELAN